ncbi:hypothetical protein GCM10022221_64050 [Actinocorallia aurea]
MLPKYQYTDGAGTPASRHTTDTGVPAKPRSLISLSAAMSVTYIRRVPHAGPSKLGLGRLPTLLYDL